MDELKQAQRTIWAAGDYGALSRYIQDLGAPPPAYGRRDGAGLHRRRNDRDRLLDSRGDRRRPAGGRRILRAPTDYASPPILWGTEDHVREMFGGVASEFEFERYISTIVWDSVESFGDFFLDHFGPMVTARQRLGERFEELRGRAMGIWADRNEADDGSLRLPQEYLLSVIRL